jgi:hypothetical protein
MLSREASAYFEAFDALAGVSLEDSWVLEVQVTERTCTFRLDLVLTPEHAAFHLPSAGEQHCYAPSTLIISASDALSFQPGPGPPARDASGELDLGHIDSFVLVDW